MGSCGLCFHGPDYLQKVYFPMYVDTIMALRRSRARPLRPQSCSEGDQDCYAWAHTQPAAAMIVKIQKAAMVAGAANLS